MWAVENSSYENIVNNRETWTWIIYKQSIAVCLALKSFKQMIFALASLMKNIWIWMCNADL